MGNFLLLVYYNISNGKPSDDFNHVLCQGNRKQLFINDSWVCEVFFCPPMQKINCQTKLILSVATLQSWPKITPWTRPSRVAGHPNINRRVISSFELFSPISWLVHEYLSWHKKWRNSKIQTDDDRTALRDDFLRWNVFNVRQQDRPALPPLAISHACADTSDSPAVVSEELTPAFAYSLTCTNREVNFRSLVIISKMLWTNYRMYL